jgi:hypothetical protein
VLDAGAGALEVGAAVELEVGAVALGAGAVGGGALRPAGATSPPQPRSTKQESKRIVRMRESLGGESGRGHHPRIGSPYARTFHECAGEGRMRRSDCGAALDQRVGLREPGPTHRLGAATAELVAHTRVAAVVLDVEVARALADPDETPRRRRIGADHHAPRPAATTTHESLAAHIAHA